MTKKNISRIAVNLTLNLLNCCKAKNDWKPEYFTNRPLFNLIDILSKHPKFENIWGHEITVNVIYFLLLNFPQKQKPNFNEDDADMLIKDIHTNLVANISKHWIVIPLRMAKLTNNIRLRDFMFITGNRDDKIKVLRRLNQMSEKEAEFWAQHTENTRSPGFFEHPLLAIKITHQTEYVEKVARLYALWTICSLQVIYWGYVYRDEVSRIYPIPVGMLRDCNHLAIWSKDKERCGHQSLNFRTICKFNLDWMSQRVHQKRFKSLFNYIVMAQNKDDKLTHRFFKALRLFGKVIDTEDNSEAFEGMGITLVYLMTIAEGVLLDQDFEKRNKLTVLLPYLAKLPDYPSSICALAIDQAYRWRSEFVHANNDKFRDWDDDFSDGIATQHTKLVKRMIAKVLSDSPKHIQKMLKQVNGDHSKLEEQWFSSLRNLWNKTLGLPNN